MREGKHVWGKANERRSDPASQCSLAKTLLRTVSSAAGCGKRAVGEKNGISGSEGGIFRGSPVVYRICRSKNRTIRGGRGAVPAWRESKGHQRDVWMARMRPWFHTYSLNVNSLVHIFSYAQAVSVRPVPSGKIDGLRHTRLLLHLVLEI